MPQLLIELFSEEIPARMQAGAARDLERMAAERLKAAGLAYEDVTVAYLGFTQQLAAYVQGAGGVQFASHCRFALLFFRARFKFMDGFGF